MITFSELGKLGRLGNQFFQYSALRSLALYHDYDMAIPNPNNKNWHGQNCLLNEFNLECSYINPESIALLRHLKTYREPNHMEYDEKFFDLEDGINLHGFFQSTLYFKHCEDQIKKELTPKDVYLQKARKTINSIKETFPEHEVVSLHLRRGDNTNGSNSSKELNEMYGKTEKLDKNSFYGKYLTSALQQFGGKKVKYLVFSGGLRFSGDDNESDIDWCKRNFKGKDFIFSKGNTTMNDLSLIMSCDHNIISHISSFGWWAAYLNQNPDKSVIAPERYHPDMPEYTHRKGFYPENWTLV
tara:strand:+ start:844 stop:1740 length:897 start_codon:yes stop_codon:yes gene_type:complete